MIDQQQHLKHLTHVEDRVIDNGHAGATHAISALHDVHNQLRGLGGKAQVSTKVDGSPSVVFGYHPENQKFFVATKSAFNKNPKLNYTPEDIEKNHGHAPGLVDKLKDALEHLPKVTPNGSILQGDLMHSGMKDVRATNNELHFKPNTITYSAKKGSAEAKKVEASKLGIAVHTKYTDTGSGAEFPASHAATHPKNIPMYDHADVHQVSTNMNLKKVNYPDQAQKRVEAHLKKAAVLTSQLNGDHSHLEGHKATMNIYVNKTVRDGTKPNTAGYKMFMADRIGKDIDGVKTQQAKQKKSEAGQQTLLHIDRHAPAFKKTFELHQHLQAAKNHIVDVLSNPAAHALHHSIGGKDAKPEGFVVQHEGVPNKFVARHEFSAANFAKQGD